MCARSFLRSTSLRVIAFSQRPSLVAAIVGADGSGAECLPVSRWKGVRSITQDMRSTSVLLDTASWIAQSSTWPSPDCSRQ